jgi:hypothetical protein
MQDLPPMSPDPSASELGSEGYRISGQAILCVGFFLGVGLGLFIPTPFNLDPLAGGALVAGSGLLGLLVACPFALWLDRSPESSSTGQEGIRVEIIRKAMTKRPQFSLAYLFLETFWIALALGLTTQAFRLEHEAASRFSVTFLLLAAQAWGAAIGGLFQRMKTGFFVISGLIIAVVIPAALVVCCIWIGENVLPWWNGDAHP